MVNEPRVPSGTDDMLLERLRRGDGAAFEQLFVRHYDRVYRVLYGLLGERRARQRLERFAVAREEDDPQDELVRSEERALVREVLARLPERQSRLLLLRHAGLSLTEVASALEVAPGSVGTLLVRAERAFANAYEIMDGRGMANSRDAASGAPTV